MKKLLLVTVVISCISYAGDQQWYDAHGSWDGYSDTDAITDETTIYLMTRGTGAYGFDGSPYLFVMFGEDMDVHGMMVDWGAFVGTSSFMSCITRIDDADAVTYTLSPISGGEKTLFYTGSIQANKEMFAQLLAGSEFIVRFTPAGQSQVTVTFSLSGLTAIALEAGVDVEYYTSMLISQ
jgi:hypothetical protein